jgi:hypothetical protein
VLTEVHGIYTAVLHVTNHRLYSCLVGGNQKDIHAFFEEDIGSFGRVRATPGPDEISVPYTEQRGVGGGRAAPIHRIHGRPTRAQIEAQIKARLGRLSDGGYGPDTLGQAGKDVSAVRFAFANGKTVVAVVKNGWYFAWWPWTSKPTSVTVRTQAGNVTSPLTSTNTSRVTVAPECKPGSEGCVFANT